MTHQDKIEPLLGLLRKDINKSGPVLSKMLKKMRNTMTVNGLKSNMDIKKHQIQVSGRIRIQGEVSKRTQLLNIQKRNIAGSRYFATPKDRSNTTRKY